MPSVESSSREKSRLRGALEGVSVHDHLCLIYETRDEQFSSVIPFIGAGLERGERCVYIVDDNTAETVLQRMREDAIDVEGSLRSGALLVVTKKDAYLKDGHFDPDLMIRFLKEATDKALADGFTALRATGEMTWALGTEPGVERLIEYEAKLNHFFPSNKVLAICQYNRSRFPAKTIEGVIHTHPIVVYKNTVCRNFYYIPPDEFLRDEKEGLRIERLLYNILERERTEEALKASEEKYRKLIEAANDAVMAVDVETGVIIEANRLAGELMGLPVERLKGLHFSKVLPPEKYEEYAEGFRETARKGEARGEAYILHSSGCNVPVEVSASFTEFGGKDVLLSIIRDITKRKKAEDALIKSEERLKEAQRVASIGSWEWDIAGNNLWWSDEIYSIFGLAPDKFGATYEAFLNTVHTEDRDFVIKSVDEALYGGKPYSIDHRIVLPDGTQKIVHEMAKVYFGAEGEGPLRMVGTVHDVTERRKAEEEARKASELERINKELEQFAMVTSHDLKEPLRIISGYLDLLVRRYRDSLGEDAMEFISYSVDGAKRMQRMIDDLLSYSKAGVLGALVPVDSEKILMKVLSNLKPAIDDASAEVTYAGLPVISGNEAGVEHLLQNLISNAIKYRSERPLKVHVSARRRGDDYLFSVSDNGRGIDAAYLGKVFEIFFRLHDLVHSGTGIGLAICKRIVEGHGGDIWVESVPGEGSTFYFTLPKSA